MMFFRCLSFQSLIFYLIIFSSCTRSTIHDSIDMNWRSIESDIGNNISLYEGYNPKVPLRGWVVLIPSKDNQIRILVSDDEDGVIETKGLSKLYNIY